MLCRAIGEGVNVQARTPVKSVSQTTDKDGYWTLTTQRGAIKARKVVFASNAYTPALLPEYREKIIPYRAASCHIVTPGPKPPPLLVNTYALRFQSWDFDYLIPRPDGSIIVGGARSAYFKDKDIWYGNADDSEQIMQARRYFDGYMQRHSRGWEDSGAHVEDFWTGSKYLNPPFLSPGPDILVVMGYSSDRLPRLGPIPDRTGLFIMAGWTGHGMPQIFLSAKGMADMVAGDIPYPDTGLPRVFEESPQRLRDARNKVLEMWHQATDGPHL